MNAVFHDFFNPRKLIDLRLSIEDWIFKVRLRRDRLLIKDHIKGKAKRHPQIFNLQFSIFNPGLSGLGVHGI
jgi:hypothetical protein